MFTRDDLNTLASASPELCVSLFMPTHAHGTETRQGPIRLKNLLAAAGEQLTQREVPARDADSLLASARALVGDYVFWQHQDRGLAVFVDTAETRTYTVPIELAEEIFVGPGFHVRPLLPALAADGVYEVLALTAGSVRLFQGSKFTLTEIDSSTLPVSVDDERGEYDYENNLQAPPVARPQTGTINISNGQVYGDSPAEWRKGRLVEFAKRVAAGVERRAATSAVPLVLVADAELGGHFRKASDLGPLLAGVVEINPEAVNERDLHEAAYAVVRPQFEATRDDALKRYEMLRGTGDGRAAGGVEDVVRAARQGRVETLLLPRDGVVMGRFDVDADRVLIDVDAHPGAASEDLLQVAAVDTLRNGGQIHLLPPDAERAVVSAVLRY